MSYEIERFMLVSPENFVEELPVTCETEDVERIVEEELQFPRLIGITESIIIFQDRFNDDLIIFKLGGSN